MRATRPVIMRIGLLCLCLGLIFVPACGGNEEAANTDAGDTASPAPPPVESRFATADGLIAEFNRLTTTSPVQIDSVVDLYYAETPDQELVLDSYRVSTMLAAFDLEFRRRFGMSHVTTPYPVPETGQPASIIERQDRRATASYISPDGSKEELLLVEVDGGWWLSCYSLESDPGFEDHVTWASENRGLVEFAKHGLPDLIRRFRNNEFFSPQAAQAAYQRALDSATASGG